MLKLIFLILASFNLHAYVNSQQAYCSTDDIKPVVGKKSILNSQSYNPKLNTLKFQRSKQLTQAPWRISNEISSYYKR